MDEQGVRPVPVFNKFDKLLRISRPRCRKAVHHFHNVVKCKLQVLVCSNVIEIAVWRIRPQQADDAAYRVGIHQALNCIEAANNNHRHTSNLNFLRNRAAASMGGNGFK